jgi:APA family basic amino acid/polyamine antiporter
MPPFETPVLRRSLGLISCTLMGVGVILGAGIYALVGKAAGLAGNAVWLSFLGAAAFSALTGLSYAELSSFIPRAGGEYYYAQRAFGDRVAFLVTWLLLAGLALVSATVALGFAGYFNALLGTPPVLTAVAAIAVSTGLLVYGIRESAWFAGFCTVLEVIGLLAIIVLGVPHLGSVDLFDAPHGAGGVASAAALIFFAYIGFEEIVQLSEETRDPTRTIPRALLLSIVVTTLLYVLVAVTAVSLVDWEDLGASEAPLARVVEDTLGSEASAGMAVIALFATFNTVLVMLLAAARLLWGMAGDGVLPAALARVHRRRKTPWVATLLVSGMAACFVVGLRQIDVVANISNFALFATFIVINGAVVALRFREPDAPRPFRVPGAIAGIPVVPVLGIAGAIALMMRTGLLAAAVSAGLVILGIGVRAVTIRRG